jgi:hypothetical protein
MKTIAAHTSLIAVGIALGLAATAHADAPAGRYTVTGGTVHDTKTNLTWQQVVPTTTYTWADAKTFCAGVGSSLGGAGWRVPTVNELLTIVDYSRSNPAVDPNYFPATPAGLFLTAVPFNTALTALWLVNFGSGATMFASAAAAFNVRCVR